MEYVEEKGVTKKEIDVKASYPLIFAISLGFFTTGIMWPHYNGFVPIFLRDYGLSLGIVGFLMTMDNWIALFLQPVIGTLSDNTKTRFGRRMPYLLIGVPLAAFFFVMIPVMAKISLILLVTAMFLFNISMAIYRSPTVALMPDLVPTQQRSIANGIINLMAGVGGIIMFLVGAAIYRIDPTLSFAFGSIVVLFALIVMFFTVKEHRRKKIGIQSSATLQDGRSEEKVSLIKEFQKVLQNPDKSQLFMLLSILAWFIAWNAIEAFWTTYGREYIGVPEDVAQQSLAFFTVFFILMSLPGGWLGTKLGRIKTMRIGVVILFLDLLVGSFLTSLTLLRIVLAIAGAAWGLININSIVVVWEHSRANVGVGTGIYYAFSSLAAVSGPPLAGFVLDILGVHTLFTFSALFLIVAFIFLIFVKTGEAGEIDALALDL